MICLSLTAPTFAHMSSDIEHYAGYIDLVELRADLLDCASALESGAAKAREFAQACIAWARGEKKQRAIQFIFTLRTKTDGGLCEAAHESERRAVLEQVMASGAFDYIDVEAEHESFCKHMYVKTQNAATSRLIVSRHWFDDKRAFYENGEGAKGRIDYARMPWLQEMKGLAELYPQALIKQALMCMSAWQLEALFVGAQQLKSMRGRYVLAPMGDFGRPARILTARSGSLWTYASAQGTRQAAAGHFDPKALCETYSYKKLHDKTRVFAVVGNPVMHSKSPEFHNAVFKKQELDAVYVHLSVDDVAALSPLMEHMNLRGLSVTIPHKSAIIPLLDEVDEAVLRCGSCNTLVVESISGVQKTRGYNTDIVGFLQPLRTRLASANKELQGMACTVVGSGGTARAVSHALLGEGARVLLVNRTLKNAEELALFLHKRYGAAVAHAPITDYAAIKMHSELIVQTTSVGMNAPQQTPLPNYEFSGKEIAYDIVYTPPCTKFLQEAQNAGCATISGEEMFVAQAQAQSELFCNIQKA